MQVSITKGERCDALHIVRSDGTVAQSDFPKKGLLPHDAIHYFVEDCLDMANGFWGMVAKGVDPAQVQIIAKAGGHASASRADAPDPAIVELVQAERIVEVFEADHWSGGSDGATLRDIARAGCEASHVPLPDLSDACVLAIRARISALQAEWIMAPPGHSFNFCWEI